MKKKILLINGSLSIGGLEKALIKFLDFFDFSEYDCDLLLMEHDETLIDRVPPQVKIYRMQKDNPYLDLSFLECIKNSARDRKNIFFVFLYFLLKNGKSVFASHNRESIRKKLMPFDKKYDAAVAFDGFYRKFLANNIKAEKKIVRLSHGSMEKPTKKDIKYLSACDSIVSLTEYMAEFLMKETGLPQNKFAVIPTNFNSDEIVKRAEEYKTERKSKYIFAATSRMVPLKNIEMMIEGMKYLTEKGINDFVCYLIGGPENTEKSRAYEKKMKELAKDLGNRIVFTGTLENPYPYVKAADIFLQTSDMEGLSNSVQEALILGVPVLSTKSAGGMAQIKPGINGELCEIRNTEDFCKKLLYMTENIAEIKAKQIPLKTDNYKNMEKWYSLF